MFIEKPTRLFTFAITYKIKACVDFPASFTEVATAPFKQSYNRGVAENNCFSCCSS